MTFLIGATGATAVEAANSTAFPTTSEIEVIIKIVVQVAIGIATLVGLFKRNKKQVEN